MSDDDIYEDYHFQKGTFVLANVWQVTAPITTASMDHI